MVSFFTVSESALFFRLILFHLLLYFFIRPKVKEKRLFPVWYGLIASSFAYVFIGDWQRGWVIIVIGIVYGFFEWLWSTMVREANQQSLFYFTVNQIVYFLMLLSIWLVLTASWSHFEALLSAFFTNKQAVAVLTGYVLCTMPIGQLINIVTKKWQDELTDDQDSEPIATLADAGRWIGISERLLIFSLVLVDQYEAIGFLIAAKSILRFREGAHKRSAYVLIGTLLSFGLAIATGLLIKLAIQ